MHRPIIIDAIIRKLSIPHNALAMPVNVNVDVKHYLIEHIDRRTTSNALNAFVNNAVFNAVWKLPVLRLGSRRSLGSAFEAIRPATERRPDDQTCWDGDAARTTAENAGVSTTGDIRDERIQHSIKYSRLCCTVVNFHRQCLLFTKAPLSMITKYWIIQLYTICQAPKTDTVWLSLQLSSFIVTSWPSRLTVWLLWSSS